MNDMEEKLMNDVTTLECLSKHPLFSGLNVKELAYIDRVAQLKSFEAKEYVLHENEKTPYLYLMMSGTVSVLKQDPASHTMHLIDTLGAGSVLGEISLIDGKPHSASVKTNESCRILLIPIEALKAAPSTASKSWTSKLASLFKYSKAQRNRNNLYDDIVKRCTYLLVSRLRSTNTLAMNALQNELALEKSRNIASRFMINVIVLLSLYTLCVQFMTEMKEYIISTSYINIPLLIMLVIPILVMMKKSGYAWKVYGLTFDNWRRASIESLIYTIPFLLIVLGYKWFLIHFNAHFSERSLFDMTLSLNSEMRAASVSSASIFLILCAYFLFVPVQEILTRGALQSSFQILLTGNHRVLWSILLSNLIFSTMHSHVSLGFGLIAYLPGLLWGWLYARHRTLVGVTISHLLLGGWSLFVVGLL